MYNLPKELKITKIIKVFIPNQSISSVSSSLIVGYAFVDKFQRQHVIMISVQPRILSYLREYDTRVGEESARPKRKQATLNTLEQGSEVPL